MSEESPLRLINDVRVILCEARGKAYAAVNTTMVKALANRPPYR
jgi:hypothetical protein